MLKQAGKLSMARGQAIAVSTKRRFIHFVPLSIGERAALSPERAARAQRRRPLAKASRRLASNSLVNLKKVPVLFKGAPFETEVFMI